MFSYKFSLSFLVGILCICSSVGGYHIKKCAKADKQALLKLKDGFIDENDILSSWNGEDCCKWKGITCNNLTGHVISLDIQYPDYFATGKLDSSICELQHLTSLSLRDVNLKGEIPKCIGSLNQLIELQLATNELVGVVPPSLGNLSNLQTLDLGYTFLVANDLKWLSHLSNLRYLDLSMMNLSQAVDWQSSISKIPSLIVLHLSWCGLCQFNPTSGNLSNLQALDLGNNLLVANDLEWLSHLSNLRYLDLSNMDLSQAIDWQSSISKIPSLNTLYLDSCRLRQVNLESIPLTNSSASLESLILSGNNLNSSILSWVRNVSKVLTYLNLSNNSLHGTLDDFGDMFSLQSLFLSFNELEGSIPKSFQKLEKLSLHSNKLSGQLSDCIRQLCGAQNSLASLHLSNNPFNSGPFPDLSRLSSLEILSLRNTNIVGPFPESIGYLPNLIYLDLSFNQLSGSLPLFGLSKLAFLECLDLSRNQLNGTLPYTIGQFSYLQELYLYSNKLNGVISEAHLSNLSRLKILEVAENSLSFNLSSNWVPPFQLSQLSASSCILGPKFPTWLKYLWGLEVLLISNSGISDSFPEWFWDLSSSLSYLNVSHNKLSGTLPTSFPSKIIESVNVWDFSFNNLSGPLPPFPELYALFLSNNMFSGSVSSFCASSPLDLTYLDLSNNLLAGSLSDCWGKFQSLKILNLAKNKLSGKIPKSFGTLRQMVSMHLNNNNFSGKIPSLTLCSNLTFIDFGDNNLKGSLPKWIGRHLHQLVILRLRANNFEGNIPTSLCNLLFLQVLDLSQNNITGEIPQCLSHIMALSNMKFPRKAISEGPDVNFYRIYLGGFLTSNAILAWKGDDREYGKNLRFMTSIDLSCNHLTGEIPQSITKLVALAGLNLSRNNLTSFIPNNIGHMEMLESLDLSKNHLYGKMPTSFSNLTFLGYMNLSFNNLSGKIPLGTQLQSFDASSYEGNKGLCGPPLTNHCPGDTISPTKSPDKHVTDEDEDELITFGFYISLGLGFFVGFWGVCGTLVVKTSWRHAYFRFFNNINDWLYVVLVVSLARMKRRFQD